MKMFFALVIVTLFGCSYGNDNVKKLGSIYNEQDCLKAGGICMIEADCTGNLIKRIGRRLCPEQDNMGVQCCETENDPRCERSNAHCLSLSDCNDIGYALEGETSNCENDEKCCNLY